MVDRTLDSSIAVGGIAALNYANKINGSVQGLSVMLISTVMYPTGTKMAAEDNINGLKSLVSEIINFIRILIILATIDTMLFTEQVVKQLFDRGAFDPQAIFRITTALFYYSIDMIVLGLRDIISIDFHSLQGIKTSMINGTIGVAINIVLNLILSKYIGLGRLTLATSISAIFCTILLFISFRKKVGSFGMKHIIISFIKVLFASLIIVILVKLSYGTLPKHIRDNLVLVWQLL